MSHRRLDERRKHPKRPSEPLNITAPWFLPLYLSFDSLQFGGYVIYLGLPPITYFYHATLSNVLLSWLMQRHGFADICKLKPFIWLVTEANTPQLFQILWLRLQGTLWFADSAGFEIWDRMLGTSLFVLRKWETFTWFILFRRLDMSNGFGW